MTPTVMAVEAANRLIQEPGLRDRLAASARERAIAECDHRVMAERSLEVYRRVPAGTSGSPLSLASGRPLADVKTSPT